MYERFTDRARKVLQFADLEAKRFNHEYIGTEHILLGLVKEGAGVAANVLKNLGIELRHVRLEVEKIVLAGPDIVSMGKLPQTPRAKKVIEYSIEESSYLKHNYVGTEHLLLGVLREQEGVAAQVLMNLGLRLDNVRTEVLNLLGQSESEPGTENVRKQSANPKTPTLDAVGQDMTKLARERKLAPRVGRAEETFLATKSLLRRTRNSPVLLGDAWDQLTILTSLARLIAEDLAPPGLRNKRVVALDLPALLANSDSRGDFDRRMRDALNEARLAKDTILALHGWDTLFAADSTRAYYSADVLKIALARGEIQCIGATTSEKFRQCVDKDRDLERLFQPITIQPATKEQILAIFHDLHNRYEAHHGVRIQSEALELTVGLAECSFAGSNVQENAMDILDEACALVQLRSAAPLDLKDIDAEVQALTLEKEAFIAEQDFEKAAHLRDQADKLMKKKELALREWREKKQYGGVVDEEVIREVVNSMAGKPGTE